MLASVVFIAFMASSTVLLRCGSVAATVVYVCPNATAVLQCAAKLSASTMIWNISPPALTCPEASISLPLNCSTTVTNLCGPFTIHSWKNMSEVCAVSSLTVSASSEVNGTTVHCLGGGPYQDDVIESYQLIVIGPPNVAIATTHKVSSIIFTLEVSSNSGVIMGNISGANQTFAITGSSAVQRVTFGGMMYDTRYDFKLMLSYCVEMLTIKTFSLRTLAPPPMEINKVAVFNHYGNVQYIELTWDHMGGSVTQYLSTIATRAGTVCGGGSIVPCAAFTCTHIQKVNLTDISYILFLSSINEAGIGPALNVTIDASNLIIEDVMQQRNSNSTDVYCRFQNHQSFYCMVCCSTDPSVPPDSSAYNISPTRGTEVTVSLQGLTNGQMYYCKAAATNTNSNNCAGPVVGGVKALFFLDLKADSTLTPKSPSSANLPFWVPIVLAVLLVVATLVTLIPILIVCTLCCGRRSQTTLQIFPAHRNVTESFVTACGEIKDASPGAFSPAEQWPGNRKYLMHGQGLVPGPGQAPVSGLVSGPVYETIVQSDARKPIITPVVAYSIQAVPHTKPVEKQMEHSYAVLERIDERSMTEESLENESRTTSFCTAATSSGVHCYAVLEQPTQPSESDSLGVEEEQK